MKLSLNKKIALLGLVLLMIAGVIVVALQGFNVSLLYEQHESVTIMFGKKIDIDEVKGICKEVFENKEVIVKSVELFDDSVNINIQSITDDQKSALTNKLNEKFELTLDPTELDVITVPNVRLRDIAKVYIKPVCITTILTLVYMVIRFRKSSALELLGKYVAIVAVSEAAIASVIAITRIPLTPFIVNLMVVFAIAETVCYIACKEAEVKKLAEEAKNKSKKKAKKAEEK